MNRRTSHWPPAARICSTFSNAYQDKLKSKTANAVSLLTSILFDANGALYTPTHANKNGRRYRYYTSQTVIKKTGNSNAPARIPAHDLENAVVDCMLLWLQTPTELLAAIRDETTVAPAEGIFAHHRASCCDGAELERAHR